MFMMGRIDSFFFPVLRTFVHSTAFFFAAHVRSLEIIFGVIEVVQTGPLWDGIDSVLCISRSAMLKEILLDTFSQL